MKIQSHFEREFEDPAPSRWWPLVQRALGLGTVAGYALMWWLIMKVKACEVHTHTL